MRKSFNVLFNALFDGKFTVLLIASFVSISIVYGWYSSEVADLRRDIVWQGALITEYENPPMGGIETEEEVWTPTFLWPIIDEDRVPIEMEITSYFGVRFSPFTSRLAMHKGLDIRGILGAQFQTPAKVEVVSRWYSPEEGGKGNGGKGGSMVLQPLDYPEYLIEYNHLSSTFYKEGTILDAGVVFARQGNSGKVAGRHGGHHLDVRIYRNGVEVNPLKYFVQEPLKE